ncbi:MAG: methyltransferase domain-containing protein [Planctomycetota bacterium]|jgi:protein arginine N-methyltransferase 1
MLDDDYALPTQLWMVRDTVRADAYRAGLQAAIRPGDKVVDAGAGTGLLSIFAAEAGAGQVTAIERSPHVAAMARTLIATTPWADRITVIAADVTTVELSEATRGDVLVSEWMGFFAVEENLLAMVCDARDRLCRPGAICLPGRFAVHAAPLEEPHRVADSVFWDSRPWGIPLEVLVDALDLRPEYGGPVLDPAWCCAAAQTLWSDDVHTLDPERAAGEWRASTRFLATRDAECTGIALWFDTEFAGGGTLSIAPGEPATHWGSSVLPLRRPRHVAAGEAIDVRITVTPTVPGHSSTFWAVRIGDSEWEHHGGAPGAEAAYELA